MDLVEAKTAIEVTGLTPQQKQIILFRGVVTQILLQFDPAQNVYFIEIEGASHTYEMDIELKKRSFSDPKLTFRNLLQEMVYPYGGDYIDRIAMEATLQKFLIQYMETDWSFLVRQASGFNTGLVADCIGDKPRFWFGIPEGIEHTVGDEQDHLRGLSYNVRRNIGGYRDFVANHPVNFTETDFKSYEVITDAFFDIGDRVTMYNRGKMEKLVVAAATARIEQGIMKFKATLTTENGMKQKTIFNSQIVGVALEGKVTGVEQDRVQLRLQIDEDYARQHRTKFPAQSGQFFPYTTAYAAEGNTGWYCMPEIGDTVQLFFPTNQENEAVVRCSVRKNKSGGDKISDPDIKYFRTKFGKEIMFSEKEIVITGKDGELLIRLNEEQGIEILSPNQVKIVAQQDLILNSDQRVMITAADELVLQCRESSIIMDGETHLKGTQVKTN